MQAKLEHARKPLWRAAASLLTVGATLWASGLALAADTRADLPPCEAILPAQSPPLSLGLMQPYGSPELAQYLAKLTSLSDGVAVCAESWSAVLPRFVPWSGVLERGYGFVFFVLAFVAAVALLSAYTPREKWKRVTLVGVLAVGALTWLGGMGLMAGFHALGGQRLVYGSVVSVRAAKQAAPEWLDVSGPRELEAALTQRKLLDVLAPAARTAASAPAPAVAARPAPTGSYRVFHRLNLREGPGVESPRLAVLPTGEEVSFDGAVDGDWWRIRTRAGQIGWTSSIWLRRPEEAGKTPAQS